MENVTDFLKTQRCNETVYEPGNRRVLANKTQRNWTSRNNK